MAIRPSHRLVALTAISAVAAAVLIISAVHTSRPARTSLLERTTKLGEDKDWDVSSWDAKHLKNVEQEQVDKISAHNIWKNPKQAWSGIDRILPTGGQYGYQSTHYVNSNQAQLVNWMDHAKRQVKRIEAQIPKKVSKDDTKEVQQLRAILEKQKAQLASVEDTLKHEDKAMDKSPTQILSQKAKVHRARVYDDNAMWGEGIQGDIRSQGHHERWTAKGAESDMDKYYARLQGKNLKELATHHQVLKFEPQHYGSNNWMDRQFEKLDARDLMKQQQHAKILKQDGYYAQHPFEHKDKAAWIHKMNNYGK
mmetsp:Transcript_42982/g.67401  ORF Transcript_42982/g.67401 Transcript_42982/m.67401 type:complete len:309 (+) Transcript_42982:2-928(+)